MNSQVMTYVPILLLMSQRCCIIIGGGLTPAFALTSLRGEMFSLLSPANGGGEVPLSLSITLPMTLYVVRAGQCSVKKVCAPPPPPPSLSLSLSH